MRILDGVDSADVDAAVDAFLADNPMPGLAYGVVLDGTLVHCGGRGLRRAADPGSGVPDEHTVFRIASMTKSFTAAAVLQLRDEGLISLDDPIAGHVPEAAGMGLATNDSAPITVRQLLTMTAGMPTDDPWGDRQQALPIDDFSALLAGGLRFAWPSGTAFEYSNLGYALLGLLLARVRGEDYADAMASRLLAPLGLMSTVFTAQEVPTERLAVGHRILDGSWVELPFDAYGAFAPMGGLFSTVHDLARWVGGFTDAFPARDTMDGGHPLRRASRREQQQPHRLIDVVQAWNELDGPPRAVARAYGFGLFRECDGRRGDVVGHSGGYPGFGSNMRWHPDSGVGVVLLGNTTYAPAPRLGALLMDRLLDGAAHRFVLAAGPTPPRAGGLWPETLQARDDVERLVTAWDDDLAARVLAMNVDLDDALPRRRAHCEALASRLGPLTRDETTPPRSDAPSHLTWWLRGPGGRVQLEIRMTPELPPRVQTLRVVGVPNPSGALTAAAGAVAAAIGAHGVPGPGLRLAPGTDPAELERRLRVASAWAGAVAVGEAVSGDGVHDAAFRLDGDRMALVLTLAVDDDGLVTRVSLTPED